MKPITIIFRSKFIRPSVLFQDQYVVYNWDFSIKYDPLLSDIHRKNLPTSFTLTGVISWSNSSKLHHRIDGPAYSSLDGFLKFIVNGNQSSPFETMMSGK